MRSSWLERLHPRRLAASPPSARQYVFTSIAFFLSYIAINRVTETREFAHTSITLWSPDDALSLLVLMQSTLYTPVVLAAAIVVDLIITSNNYDLSTTLVSEFVLTQGYLIIAVALRDFFAFDFREASYANAVALLAVAPLGAAFTGLLYCIVLYAAGALPASEFLTGLKNFWVGDSVGVIVVLPGATAIYDLVRHERWRGALTSPRVAMAAFVALGVAPFVVGSVSNVNHQYLFDLLFLPTIWVGISFGFNTVALLLFVIQAILIGATSYFRTPDDEFVTYQTLMLVLAATGLLLGAAVTEREAATRLVRRQQADLARISAHAANAALAASFAHEISQPLSSLAGYLHGARRMLDQGQPSEKVARALGGAEAEARRAREIITRIRDFVASGKLDLKLTDLGELALKIVALNKEEAAQRNVRVFAEPPERPTSALVDRIAVEQALNNLVVNAIEAIGAGATGEVSVRVLEVDGRTLLQVDDDGPGVAAEIADRLFDPFETTKPQGMGLGLQLALQVAEKHGGQLTWRPRTPRGASFLIELPIHGPQERAA